MDLNASMVEEFLLTNRNVNISQLSHDGANASDLIVMAHVTDIISQEWWGLQVRVIDHSGFAVFNLKGAAAFEFYEKSLTETAVDCAFVHGGFRFNDQVNQTFLFNIDCQSTHAMAGNHAYVVKNICTNKDIIDNFCYRMDLDEYACYRYEVDYAKSATNEKAYLTKNNDSAPTFTVQSFKKRVYASPAEMDLAMKFSNLDIDN